MVLFFSFIGMFIRFWRLNLWERNDSVWMTKLRDVLANREEGDTALTEVGKYNAGQKMVFWSMSVLIIVLISSGVVIWDQYFSPYTSVEQKRIAVLVHSIAAVVASRRIGRNPNRSPASEPSIDAGTPPRLPTEIAVAICVAASPDAEPMRSE